MASRKYREIARETVDTLINEIEAEVGCLVDTAEKIDTDSVSAMKDGIEAIISDLKELADKLY